MKKQCKYTDSQFIEAVKDSISIASVFQKLGIRPTGGNYTHFKFTANRLGVDWSHFKGMGHMAGKSHDWSPKIPLEDVLVIGSTYANRSSIKRRLLKAGLIKYHCVFCGIDKWRDATLALHLDHINGDPTDHRLENLRLLCPNCHSQTPTFGSKQRYDAHQSPAICTRPRQPISRPKHCCCDCSKSIDRKAVRCKPCAGKARERTKIDWPSKDTLMDMIQASNYSAVARKLGISDNAIRKHLLKN